MNRVVLAALCMLGDVMAAMGSYISHCESKNLEFLRTSPFFFFFFENIAVRK